ncbi:response regulator transcription factor [Pseudanabaenaceae cyanobacterium LEGE 13415]|nr:response regulator transcription factor [Pseudanabaenaceae cyanobacterium LEGE 13415]
MIQILIVEDQEIVRRGLRTMLQRKPDFQVVGEAANGQDAIALVSTLYGSDQQPDVILMDIQMPVMDGVAATQHICQHFPEIKVLVLTTFDDAPYITEAMRCGAKGYVLKDTPSKELAEIVRSIDRGYTQFSPGILEKMMTVMQPKTELIAAKPTLPTSELPPGFTELTSREREVLCLIAAGKSNREIAEQLCVTEGTARNHISHILSRLNLRDRTQAAIVANAFLAWLENPDTLS